MKIVGRRLGYEWTDFWYYSRSSLQVPYWTTGSRKNATPLTEEDAVAVVLAEPDEGYIYVIEDA